VTAGFVEEASPSIARGGGVAAWRQIADRLAEDIHAGRLHAGEQLPVEAVLAERFAVNRHTLRRALAALAADGLVRTAQGRGTFVEDKLRYAIGARTRFSELVSRAGREAGGTLIAAARVAAERRVAAALRLGEGDGVVRLETMRSADGVPISLGVAFFPLPRFAKIAQAYRKLGGVTRALEACGVPDYRRVETRVSARAASGSEAQRLDLNTGRPVLTVDSVNVDGSGVPIQFTRAVFAADRTELVVES
jgi:GntR family phosphonate transport system transcriptional regulator